MCITLSGVSLKWSILARLQSWNGGPHNYLKHPGQASELIWTIGQMVIFFCLNWPIIVHKSLPVDAVECPFVLEEDPATDQQIAVGVVRSRGTGCARHTADAHRPTPSPESETPSDEQRLYTPAPAPSLVLTPIISKGVVVSQFKNKTKQKHQAARFEVAPGWSRELGERKRGVFKGLTHTGIYASGPHVPVCTALSFRV